jgi:tRNA modification GTPase
MEDAAIRLTQLTKGYETGKVLKEGIDCVIIGRPNVGKSSLFNTMLGKQRAIVTPVAGTTRDVVEAYAKVGTVTLKLRDTAGIRETEDPIEDIGVEKARDAVKQAALAIVVIDGSQPLTDEDRTVLDFAKDKKALLIINKSDMEQDPTINEELQQWTGNFKGIVEISAKTGSGIDQLEHVINELYSMGDIKPDGTFITNARQEGACRTAELILRGAINSINGGFPPDMILYDVEQAMERIGEILGRNTPMDIIDRIFENFCVGK